MAEPDRRDIDADTQAFDVSCLAAHRPEHIHAGRLNAPAAFGDADEFLGLEGTGGTAGRAHERFDAHRRETLRIDEGLVDHIESIPAEAAGDLALDLAAQDASFIERRLIGLAAAFAIRPGRIHGRVGAAQQFKRAVRIGLGNRDADVRVDLQATPSDLDRRG
jgi:hypothetical protein